MKNEQALKGEALFGDALVAFASALLLGRAWQMPEDDIDLFFIFFSWSIPDYTGVLMILGLLVLSAFLIFASFASMVGDWVFRSRLLYKPVLEMLGVTGFVIGWASAIADLPGDQRWTLGLEFGGAALVIVLFLRCLHGLYQSVRRGLSML